MPRVEFELKKADDALTQLANFDERPSWEELASLITDMFHIPSEHVSVGFIDKGATITFNDERWLCHLYSFHQPTWVIKLVVQDLRYPDAAIPSTWLKNSDLSKGSKQSSAVRHIDRSITASDDELELFCWIFDSSDSPFSVDIGASKSVGYLKKVIKMDQEPKLDDLLANSLVLWKLKEPVGLNETFMGCMGSRGRNLAVFATQLSSESKMSAVFPQHPSRDQVHILVQLPPTKGPKHLSVQHYQRRTIYQDCFTNEIVAIHKAIKALPNDLDLANPAISKNLPFPTPLAIPFQRFEFVRDENVNYFSYMGRLKFKELYDRLEHTSFILGYENLYLYGSSGSGKSHILAALVCQLIREGKRVVYVPDCVTLVSGFLEVIRTALRCAFYDSPFLETIQSLTSIEALIEFWRGQQDVYFIVDQLNALEVGGSSSSTDEMKKQVTMWLNEMQLHHKYIFSASANEKSNVQADKKQSGITVIHFRGGMNREETDYWFSHNSHRLPELSPEDRLLIDYLTGCLPLLLRSLVGVKDFDEQVFVASPNLRKVNEDTIKFYADKQAELVESKMELYHAIMEACLQGTPATDMKDLYDLRYFYVDEDGIGRYTCGIAFETMMAIFRQHRFNKFSSQEWYSAVLQSTRNPVIQDFLAEHICLNHISTDGLQVVDKRLQRMDQASFTTQPNWDHMLQSDKELCLYVPTGYNFRAVDGVILLLDHSTKKAHLFLLQITLSMRHKQSDQDFYSKMWFTWIQSIMAAGFTVKSTFVWIDKKQPSTRSQPALTKSLRSGNRIVQPEYHSTHVGILQVDRKLAKMLGLPNH